MRRFFVLFAATAALTACQDGMGYQENQRTYQGAGIGAALGGLAGSVESREHAAAGAGIGALAGGAVGQYMDRQERAMRQQLQGTGIEVQRQGDDILLNIPNSITFDFDSARIWSQAEGTLRQLAGVLNQYPQTKIDVMGHTDGIGSDAYNQTLSEKRAQAVANKLRDFGVASGRLMVLGYGKTRPIATNDTEAGRAQNRRVEVRISPVKG